jgi:hypothetical protein
MLIHFSSYFNFITDDQLQKLGAAYPDDVTQVSGRGFWKLSLIACRALLSALELPMP